MSEDIQELPVKAVLWRIIVDPIEIKTKTDSGFDLPQSTIEAQEYLRYVGKVLDIGPLAFQQPQFFDNKGDHHPPCKVGDWVIYGRHTGSEIFIKGTGTNYVQRLKTINDDQILSLVKDIDQVRIPL